LFSDYTVSDVEAAFFDCYQAFVRNSSWNLGPGTSATLDLVGETLHYIMLSLDFRSSGQEDEEGRGLDITSHCGKQHRVLDLMPSYIVSKR
jgi:hypothetical protein